MDLPSSAALVATLLALVAAPACVGDEAGLERSASATLGGCSATMQVRDDELAQGTIRCSRATRPWNPLPSVCVLDVAAASAHPACDVFVSAIQGKVTLEADGTGAILPGSDPATLYYQNYDSWRLWTAGQRAAIREAMSQTLATLPVDATDDDTAITRRYLELAELAEAYADRTAGNPIVPTEVSPAMIDRFHAQDAGQQQRFSRIGDCHSTAGFFLGNFDASSRAYTLPAAPYGRVLADVIAQFNGPASRSSFARGSVAAEPSQSANMTIDAPAWDTPVDPKCPAGISRLDCELLLQDPGFALITLGTNDSDRCPPAVCPPVPPARTGDPATDAAAYARAYAAATAAFVKNQRYDEFEFEQSMREVLARTLGVATFAHPSTQPTHIIPIVGTKPDVVYDGEPATDGATAPSPGRFNKILFWLAAEYEVPLWDLDQATTTQMAPHASATRADSPFHQTWMGLYGDRDDGRAWDFTGLARFQHDDDERPHASTTPPPAGFTSGQQAKNLTGLAALDAVWRAAKAAAP